jgi:hypothetical protein
LAGSSQWTGGLLSSFFFSKDLFVSQIATWSAQCTFHNSFGQQRPVNDHDNLYSNAIMSLLDIIVMWVLYSLFASFWCSHLSAALRSPRRTRSLGLLGSLKRSHCSRNACTRYLSRYITVRPGEVDQFSAPGALQRDFLRQMAGFFPHCFHRRQQLCKSSREIVQYQTRVRYSHLVQMVWFVPVPDGRLIRKSAHHSSLM